MLRPIDMGNVSGRAIGALMLLLLGCSDTSGGSTPLASAAPATATVSSSASRAAFLPGPGPGYEALATGRLRGDPRSGCLWLQVASGAEEQVRVFDDAAYVDFAASPAEVRTSQGRLLLRLGDQVSLTGGHVPVRPAAPGLVEGCPVAGDTVFMASRFPR